MTKETTKHQKFTYKAIMAWVIAIGLIVVLKSIVHSMGGVEASGLAAWLNDLSSVIFLFGVCGIPVILLCSVGLRYAEQRIGDANDKNQEQ